MYAIFLIGILLAMERAYSGFTSCYWDLLKSVFENPTYECAPRGQRVKEQLAVKFTLADPRARLAFVPAADRSVSYAVAESLWYLTGNDETDWIGWYAPFWRGISDDGKTANSAYGARIFRRWHPRVHGHEVETAWELKAGPMQSQWEYIKEELRRDPDSRRAVIQIRSATDSWLAKRDVPCTLALQFFLREGRLHLIVSMRSSDLVIGLPYDVFAFTLFQELMALELAVGLGSYTHVSNSLHVYERDFRLVQRTLASPIDIEQDKSMPAIMTHPPTVTMAALECQLRAARSARDVVSTVREASGALELLHGYWMDWIRVLAAHRAGRLGLLTLSRALRASTSWNGYAKFTR